RVRRIKRLTQEMGVNLAGVEIILRLLDEMEEMRSDLEREMEDYARDIEARLQSYFANSKAPIRIDAPLVPMPQFQTRKKSDL
ncbi:MAG: MerR family transcriptional regulator, partial [Armatimonadetes bacterium]|nr:MerR family transcriptional regulator [Armatimonadota bacterium]